MTAQPPLPDMILEPLVRATLAEDLGTYGDITTRTVIPAGTRYLARIIAREAGVASGMQVAAIAFRLVDPGLAFRVLVPDGAPFDAGAVLAEIEGEAASILTAERVALNFAGRLSGIATLTRPTGSAWRARYFSSRSRRSADNRGLCRVRLDGRVGW